MFRSGHPVRRHPQALLAEVTLGALRTLSHAPRPAWAAGRYSCSRQPADGAAPHSEVRPSTAYYAVIAGAVSKLPNNTPQARQALYDRAGIALGAELLHDPEISDEQVAGERLALERAMRKVEDDEHRKEQPPSPPQQSGRGPFSLLLSLLHVFRRR